jgi:hypothetical protein
MTSPVLARVHARVDFVELDFETSSFVLAGSVYLLGNASKHVKTLKDFTTKNKPLVSALGVETIKALSATPSTFRGGVGISGIDDDDPWDDFENMDDLLDTESPIRVNTSTDQSTIRSNGLQGDHFSNYTFYSKDKPSDIRDKIAVITNIPPYKQYLWSPEARRSLGGDEVSIFHHWTTAIRHLEGYAVDGRGDVRTTELAMDAFTTHSSVIITCVSLDSIVHKKSKLHFLARSDTDSYELIYNNTIRPFFPLVTLSIFNQYLSDENALTIKFDVLDFDKAQLVNEYASRDKLISELNKIGKIVMDTNTANKIVNATTTSIVLSANPHDLQHRIDTMRLFQMFNIATQAQIASIDIYTIDNDKRGIRLRKLQQRDQFRVSRDESNVVTHSRSKRQMMYDRVLTISFLPNRQCAALSMSIDRYGCVWIKANPSFSRNYSKNAFVQIIAEIVNPIIAEINTHTMVFMNQSRLSLIFDSMYKIVSSSTTLTFKFSVGYDKILGIIVDKLLRSGFVSPTRQTKGLTSFRIDYGVSRSELLRSRSAIDIRNLSGIGIVILSNLDVEETKLYVDLLGRMIVSQRSNIEVKTLDKLSAIDPVLFRPRLSADSYSRICQRKFQPVITTQDDPKGTEFYNFTFQRPEFYKCPKSSVPVLGFIEGRHDKGYCLPCCRKTVQSNSTQLYKSCIARDDTIENSRSSGYKIEYPHGYVVNSKIANRRVSIPSYVCQLFGLDDNIIANGAVLAVVGAIRDDLDNSYQSYLQTAALLASVMPRDDMKPEFSSVREFIFAIIAMIKQPLVQSQVMRHPIVHTRFTSPQALIHAIEDQFCKKTVLVSSLLSAVEWNDLMISLANVLGLNVLLLSDDRSPNKGIQVDNFHEIDVHRSVVIFLKRLSTEWSVANHNTRALYLPLTHSQYRVSNRSQLSIQRFQISKSLEKLQRVSFGGSMKLLSKQLTVAQLQAVANHYTAYRVDTSLLEHKLAIVELGPLKMITTVCTVITVLEANVTPIAYDLTATLKEVLTFVTDYNLFHMRETNGVDALLQSYKLYLQVALTEKRTYELVALKAYILKVGKFIVVNEDVIGVILHVVDVKTIIATELVFFKSFPATMLDAQLATLRDDLASIQQRMDVGAILCYPVDVNVLTLAPQPNHVIVNWLNHPLRLTPSLNDTCSKSLIDSYSTGVYRNGIYRLLSKDIVTAWSEERPRDLLDAIIHQMKSMSSSLPYTHTKIESLISTLVKRFIVYDPMLLRVAITHVFELINSIDKTPSKAMEHIRNGQEFDGFDVKNIHRLTSSQLTAKIHTLCKELTIKTNTYPVFKQDVSVGDQDATFYDSKTGKLLVHEEMSNDLMSMIVSDFSNPFRRDFLLNQPLVETTFSDIQPHIGEVIYVQPTSNTSNGF